MHSSYDEPQGVLNHLFSSVHHKSIKLNGTPISEGEISAAVAGYFGIPTVLVTGDDVTCAEMKRFIPNIETAVVKYAISRFAARCLPFARTEPMIREAAKRAVLKAKEGQIAPYTYKGPQDLTVELNTPYRAKTIAELTKAEYLQPTTIKYTASDAMEVYRVLRLVLYLSNSSLLP
jgi:D-amino peptidase